MRDKFTGRKVVTTVQGCNFPGLVNPDIYSIFDDLFDDKLSSEEETRFYESISKSGLKKPLAAAVYIIFDRIKATCNPAQILNLTSKDKQYGNNPKGKLPKLEFLKHIPKVVSEDNLKQMLKEALICSLFTIIFADESMKEVSIDTEMVNEGINKNEEILEEDKVLLRTIFNKEDYDGYIEKIAIDDIKKINVQLESEKEQLINEKNELIEKHEQEISNIKNKYKELENKIKEVEKENQETEKNDDHKDLLNRIAELEDELANEKSINKEISKKEEQESTESFEENRQTILKELEEETDQFNGARISADEIIDDISSGYRIGYIPGNSLQRMNDANRTWAVNVNPYVPTVPDVNYLDKETLTKKTNYKFGSFIQNFLFFIDKNIYEMLDPQFNLLTEDEQRSLIYDEFCRKNVLFNITKTRRGGDRFEFKADVVETSDYNDFSNSVYIPIISNMSQKSFKMRIAKESEIEIPNFPVTLFTKINYVIIDNELYKVNLAPKISCYKNRCIWYSQDKSIVKLAHIDLENTDNYYYIQEDDCEYLLAKNEYLTRLEVAYDNSQSGAKDAASKGKKTVLISEDEFINRISTYAKKNKLCYNYDDIKNFHISIKTSNLVILAGPSGLGKSRLPELYASAMDINEDKNQLLFVPVNPSFTEPSDLLGYVKPYIYNDKKPSLEEDSEENKLENKGSKVTLARAKNKGNVAEAEENSKTNRNYDGVFEESSTQIVSFLQNAHHNKDKLYMVIFDEMNLSQIEYWFAPFMSVLERETTNRNIQLYSKEMNIENSEKYPPSINVGDNVIFIGTINMDETTKDISDRLLDRALVINLHKKTFKDYLAEENETEEETDTNIKVPSSLFASFKKNTTNYIKVFTEQEIIFLDELHDLISSSLPQKGVSYRNIKMIANYIANSENIFDRKTAFDLAIKQTVIRKINGNENEIGRLVYDTYENNIRALLEKNKEISDFKESLLEIKQKAQELDTYGFTR